MTDNQDIQAIAEKWYVPLSCENKTLREAYLEMKVFGLKQEDVPFIIQLVENPKFDLPGIDIFHGSAELETHDHIHILLGRGVLPKDEAFVLGFTMGCTNRVSGMEEQLYTLIARYLYPKGYRFSEADIRVYRDAVRLGFISDCHSLAEVDYQQFLDTSLQEIRNALSIESDLLRAYYSIEKRRNPDCTESQRLLD